METYMKIHTFKGLLAGVLMLTGLAGCGGGGGGGGGDTTTPPGPYTVIKGTASKGIIYPGTVSVYSIGTDGAKGGLLGSAATDINGTYSATLGSYSGAIQVEASGTYTDEATGQTVTIDPSRPLHALVEKVDNSTTNNRIVSVTPLTEIAWRKASVNGTVATPPATIVSSNTLVEDLFKVRDITGIEPVRPDTATMASASQESQAYTLALASISQMATTRTGATHTERLDAVLNTMTTEVQHAETSGSMSTTATTDFSNALNTVSLGDDFPSARDQIAGTGKISQKLTLTISGTLPTGTKIFALQGSIALPAGVTLRSDSGGETMSEVLYLLDATKQLSSVDPIANYLAPQQQLDFSMQFDPSKAGLGTGDFAVLKYDVAASATVTAADFSIIADSVSAKDINGATISGVTVTLR
jgi:hypothetical protein